MKTKEILLGIIDKLIFKSESWIQKEDNGLYSFIDPNDGEEISSHYGATHAAAPLSSGESGQVMMNYIIKV